MAVDDRLIELPDSHRGFFARSAEARSIGIKQNLKHTIFNTNATRRLVRRSRRVDFTAEKDSQCFDGTLDGVRFRFDSMPYRIKMHCFVPERNDKHCFSNLQLTLHQIGRIN